MGLCLAPTGVSRAAAQTTAVEAVADSPRAVLDRYCVGCHNDRSRQAGLTLQSVDLARVGQVADEVEVWEKVAHKLRARAMPPPGRPRPDGEVYDEVARSLETALDQAARAAPNPGQPPVHRLNRVEYRNAVRDLLVLELDETALLPPDESGYGFDNIADILAVSPLLLDRYMAAAEKISRLALGDASSIRPAVEVHSVPYTKWQDGRMSEWLPFGSRGGLAVRHHFPVDGEYDLKIRLHRNYVDYVRGLGSQNELDVRLDGVLVTRFTFGGDQPLVRRPPASYAGNIFGDAEWEEYALFADADLEVRFPAQAGPRVVGVSFVRSFAESDGVLQPRQTTFALAVNDLRDGHAAVDQVAIGGPYTIDGPGQTPSRRAVFICRPADRRDEEPCAREILSSLARRAYRRPVTDAEAMEAFAPVVARLDGLTEPTHGRVK